MLANTMLLGYREASAVAQIDTLTRVMVFVVSILCPHS